ncbi:TOBE domain-containing protein [Rhizobium miluonense]|uniref:TOBE domain-containing protein n=1 Tax=Rhizobium miluonense TaxID=411945 RepID=A0A1C3UZZ2_9HYPH|nr:TOBE domain-containing protein [Rhizobium miluonense]SCB21062.1 TOBE domain-containing protein [Rhizobium miluonense]
MLCFDPSNFDRIGSRDAIGIRPKDLYLGDAQTGGAFQARVRVQGVELVGAESYVYGVLADGQAIVFRVSGRPQIGIDSELTVASSTNVLRFFVSRGNRTQ